MTTATVDSLSHSANYLALAKDLTRLSILEAINTAKGKRLHVGGMCEVLDKSQAAVSHHLSLMRVAGIIESERDGKRNYYHLTNVGRKIVKFVNEIGKDTGEE